jgi:hypothetical protein
MTARPLPTYASIILNPEDDFTTEVDIRTLPSDRLAQLRDEAAAAGDWGLVRDIDMASTSTNCTAADFLVANEVTHWEALTNLPGHGRVSSDLDAMADAMLKDWTFDGALVPDRADLIAALKVLRAG